MIHRHLQGQRAAQRMPDQQRPVKAQRVDQVHQQPRLRGQGAARPHVVRITGAGAVHEPTAAATSGVA